MTKKLNVKVFIGFPVNGEIHTQLHQSHDWNRAKLLNEPFLKEIQHEEKSYIGQWLESPVSFGEVKKKEKEIKSQLQLYCPKLNLDNRHVYLFPQVFLL